MTKKANKTRLSSKKREAIINAALKVFLEHGYGSSSIDEIVKVAGGSKATIYKHFKNKQELFEIVIDKLVRDDLESELIDMDAEPEKALYDFGVKRLTVVFNEQHSSLRRLVIGESVRFPEVAQLYYKHGPVYSHNKLSAYLQKQQIKGSLEIEDVEVAASFFQSMLIHPLYLKVLFSISTKYSTKYISKQSRIVVENFLKLYSSNT